MSRHDFGLNRRAFLSGSAAFAGTVAVGGRVGASSALLTIASRQIEVLGRSAQVFGVTGPDGRSGLIAREGDRFAGLVRNATSEPLVMHWHGQTQAAAFEDRARPNGGAIGPGEADAHDFPLTAGTHWTHAHQLSEQQLLAGPMIARERDAGDVRDVVIMLHDFAFRSPAEILAELRGATSSAMPSDAAGHGGMAGMHGARGATPTAPAPSRAMIHANDVGYDAFLANDRTFDDPEVVEVERGSLVRLRIINGATASAFWIDCGPLRTICAAVDGTPCLPYAGRSFPLAQGQRLDLVVTIPREGGAFPITAQLEAERKRTGLVLATTGATIRKIEGVASGTANYADLSLDQSIRAAKPLGARPASRTFRLPFGEQPGYRWTLAGAVYGEHRPIEARVGERVAFVFENTTSMMHPMHLHGHHFQVVGIGTHRFDGPVRDTVIVPPNTSVTVAVDLDKPGDWLLHCHHLYHMAAGMMTDVKVV